MKKITNIPDILKTKISLIYNDGILDGPFFFEEIVDFVALSDDPYFILNQITEEIQNRTDNENLYFPSDIAYTLFRNRFGKGKIRISHFVKISGYPQDEQQFFKFIFSAIVFSECVKYKLFNKNQINRGDRYSNPVGTNRYTGRSGCAGIILLFIILTVTSLQYLL